MRRLRRQTQSSMDKMSPQMLILSVVGVCLVSASLFQVIFLQPLTNSTAGLDILSQTPTHTSTGSRKDSSNNNNKQEQPQGQPLAETERLLLNRDDIHKHLFLAYHQNEMAVVKTPAVLDASANTATLTTTTTLRHKDATTGKTTHTKLTTTTVTTKTVAIVEDDNDENHNDSKEEEEKVDTDQPNEADKEEEEEEAPQKKVHQPKRNRRGRKKQQPPPPQAPEEKTLPPQESLSVAVAADTTEITNNNNNNNNIAGNKTLVIIMGSLRGGEVAWNTLYENFLDVNHADLALLIGKGSIPKKYKDASILQRAKYHWTFREWKDWGDAMDTVPDAHWRDYIIDDLMLKRRKLVGGGLFGAITVPEQLGSNRRVGLKGSGAVIFMIRHFLSDKLKELDLTSKYDRFVVTRADHYYLCKHDLSLLDPKYVWIPDGETFEGLTDRHHIFNKDDVLKGIDIFPPLLRDPQKYESFLLDNLGKSSKFYPNPELLIKYRWQEEGLTDRLKMFPRVMFTCADKTGDATRWQRPKFSVPEGVRLKYKEEYYASHKTCNTTGVATEDS